MDDRPSSSKDPNMEWMYGGTKSIVNREDYLLGKKIDKNFELYSDVVVKDKDEEGRDNFFKQKLLQNGSGSHNQKISALDVRTVRNEDPLVALKFQEEQRRRQMLDNPLLKLKAQRILQKEFEKQMKKGEKKKKKHKKSKRSSFSSDEEIHSKQRRVDEKERHHRHSSEERSGSSRGRERREDSRKRNESHHHRDSSSRSSVDKRTDSGSYSQRGEEQSKEKTQSRPKLSAAEIEERRKAMLQNASWRDEMRESNFKKTIEQLQKEENEANNVPNFIRPVMDSANSSLEKRLQSNKMGIQRSHDHMDKSFLRK
ncbi:hypothetical protein ACQ4LE_008807 [Meloidogyne hapla]